MAVPVLMTIGAYLFGAIPTANVLALTFRGVDLRNYGTGAVTSSNVGELLGKWAVVTSGIGDILKGAGPVWGAQALGLNTTEQMVVGLATIVGHNWSVFLRFQGGRGLAVVLGVLIAVAPVEFMIFSVIGFFGVAFFANVPIVLGLSTLLLPVWSAVLQEEAPIIWGTGIMVFLVAAKRLIGNKLEALPAQGRGKVLLYRFLYDRDIREHKEWVRRGDSDRITKNP